MKRELESRIRSEGCEKKEAVRLRGSEVETTMIRANDRRRAYKKEDRTKHTIRKVCKCEEQRTKEELG